MHGRMLVIDLFNDTHLLSINLTQLSAASSCSALASYHYRYCTPCTQKSRLCVGGVTALLEKVLGDHDPTRQFTRSHLGTEE